MSDNTAEVARLQAVLQVVDGDFKTGLTQAKALFGGAAAEIAGGLSKLKEAVGVLASPSGIAAAAASAVVAIGAAGMRAASEYGKAAKQIRVATGATGDALAGLTDDLKAVMREVPASVGDAATAIGDLNTRLGLSGKPLQDLSSQILTLTRITGAELGGVIRESTRLFGDWGVKQSDMAGALDKVFRASQSTGIGVEQLMSTMVRYGAPLRQFGFSFDEAAALMGKFEKEGVNLELVTGSLRIALGKFAKDGVQNPRAELEKYIEVIKNAKTAGEANAIAFDVFGARAGADMAAAIREGRFEIDDYVKTIAGGSDTIEKAGRDTMSFGAKMKVAGQNMQQALVPIGQPLVALRSKIGDLLMSASQFVAQNLPAAVQWLGHAFGGVKTAIEPLLPLFSPMIAFFTEAKKSVGEALKPALDALKGAWDSLASSMTAIAQAVWPLLKPVLALIGGSLIGVMTLAAGLLGGIGRAIGGVVLIVTGVIKTIAGVIQTIVGLLTGNKDTVKKGAETAFGGLKTVVEGVVKAVGGFFSGMRDTLANIISTLASKFDPLKKVLDSVVGWFSSMKQRVVDTVEGLVSAISKPVQKVRDALSDLNPFKRHSPSLVEQVEEGTKRIRAAYEAVHYKGGKPQVAAPVGDKGTVVNIGKIIVDVPDGKAETLVRQLEALVRSAQMRRRLAT